MCAAERGRAGQGQASLPRCPRAQPRSGTAPCDPSPKPAAGAAHQVGVVVDELVARLTGARVEAVGPGGDVPGHGLELRPQPRVGEQAGGDDEEVEQALIALGRGHVHLSRGSVRQCGVGRANAPAGVGS